MLERDYDDYANPDGTLTLVMRWGWEDVAAMSGLKKKKMTKEQAEKWLEENGSALENAMTEFGWDAIKSLL